MNRNFLSPNGYMLSLERVPHIEYFLKSVSLPGISMSSIKVNTPIKTFNVHGDSAQKESMSCMIHADEDLEGFKEIYSWIKGLTGEDGFNTHKTLKDGPGLYSDGTLTILNNAGNPNLQFRFERLFPISLGGLEFTAAAMDIGSMSFSVNFEHDGYTIHNV